MKNNRWFISVLIGLGSVIGVLSLLSMQLPSAQAINLSPQANCVAGPHSGTLGTQDWCPADNPHQITDNVIVPDGVTLTLRPGVIVQAASGKRLQVTGVLIGIGTPAEPITLTSSTDSGPGQWAGLYLTQGEADLRYVTVRYAGQYNTWGYASINVAYSTLYLENSQIRDSRNAGNADFGVHLCCDSGNASATVSQTQFINIGDTTADVGIFSNSASNPITVVNSTFQNVAGYPIQTPGESLSRISGNIFSGNAFNRILILGGTPGTVGAGARLSAQTGLQGYELTGGQLSVPPGVTLTVEPGVTLLAQSNTYLHILGHLAASGTSAQPITFTSAADSGPGQWAGVYIQEGSGDLSYLALRCAGQTIPGNFATGAILLQIPSGKPVNLDHVTLRDNALAGGADFALSINGSRVTLTDSLITGNGDAANDYAIYLNAGVLTTTRSTIQSNAGTGLYVGDGRATVNCSTVYTNGSDGVRVVGSAQFSALGSGFQANAGAGLTNTGGLTATAIYNWWGAASGPGGAGPGLGDEVSAKVDFTPWLTRPGCDPDLAISKTGPANVAAGERITYTLTVTNSGAGAATNLVISDTLPVGAYYVSGGTLAGNVVRFAVPSMPGAGGVITVQFAVTATQIITNSDYGVAADGGVSALGTLPVITIVGGASPTYTLTIHAAGNGSGVITPTVGTYSYTAGSAVVLTATAHAGSTFVEWSGDAGGSINPVTVTMTANRNVTATFNLIPVITYYTLTLNYAGTGSGTVVKSPNAISYTAGSAVSLTATAHAGSIFAGWSGDADGSISPVTVTMTANKSVTATFNLSSGCDPIGGLGFTYTPIAPRVGQSVSFTATITAGTLPVTYTWSWGDGTLDGIGTPLAHTFPLTSTVATYTVTLTTANACGAAAPVGKTVLVKPHRLYLPLVRK